MTYRQSKAWDIICVSLVIGHSLVKVQLSSRPDWTFTKEGPITRETQICLMSLTYRLTRLSVGVRNISWRFSWTHIYMVLSIHIIHTYVCTCVCTSLSHACTCLLCMVWSSTTTNMWLRAFMHLVMYFVYACSPNKHMWLRAFVHFVMYFVYTCSPWVSLCVYVCMYACMYLCMSIRICHTCIQTCTFMKT